MLTIGEFSRLTRIPAKTLRYYDEIDLFKPAQVDSLTGYRYYNLAQLPRLYRIMALKALGLSLQHIQHILDEDLSIEQIRGMLRLKRVELKQMVAEMQEQLDYVELKLQQLDNHASLLNQYTVIVKDIPSTQIAVARDIVPHKQKLKDILLILFTDVHDYLRQYKVKPSGAGMTLYFDEEYRETRMNVGAAFPINEDVPSTERISIEILPAQLVVSAVHYGALEKMEQAYSAILAWLDQSPYQITGSAREIGLHYVPDGNPADFVTEIQFPVTKRSSS